MRDELRAASQTITVVIIAPLDPIGTPEMLTVNDIATAPRELVLKSLREMPSSATGSPFHLALEDRLIALFDASTSDLLSMADKLRAVQAAGATHATIDTDSGELRMTLAEALQMFDELAPGEGFELVAVDWRAPEQPAGQRAKRGRRDYYQLGRSDLLHVVIFDIDDDSELTECGRPIYETGRLANDVEDQPLCTHCRRRRG